MTCDDHGRAARDPGARLRAGLRPPQGPRRTTSRKTSGFIAIESSEPARTRLCPSFGSNPSATPSPMRMKENSPICARAAETVSAVRTGCFRSSTTPNAASDFPATMTPSTMSTRRGSCTRIAGSNSIPTATKKRAENASSKGLRSERGERLPRDDDPEHHEHAPRLLHQDRRIEQHSDRDEEEGRECVLEGLDVRGGPVGEVRAVHEDAGAEGPERERDSEEVRREIGHAERQGDHAEREELARAGAADVMEDPGEQAGADDEHRGDEDGELSERDPEGGDQPRRSCPRRVRPRTGENRQEDEHEHHEQVLDD